MLGQAHRLQQPNPETLILFKSFYSLVRVLYYSLSNTRKHQASILLTLSDYNFVTLQIPQQLDQDAVPYKDCIQR
jgi:hypothetical protein